MNDRFEQIGTLIILCAFVWGAVAACEQEPTRTMLRKASLTTYQELDRLIQTRQAVALERIADSMEREEDKMTPILEDIMDKPPEKAREIIQTKLAMRESKLMLEYWSLWQEVNDE
jgi:hypothetical protein